MIKHRLGTQTVRSSVHRSDAKLWWVAGAGQAAPAPAELVVQGVLLVRVVVLGAGEDDLTQPMRRSDRMAFKPF